MWVQIQDLAASHPPGSRVSALPPRRHLHSAIVLPRTSVRQQYALHLYHPQGFPVTSVCTAELSQLQENLCHSFQLSLELRGTRSGSDADRGWQNLGKSSWTASALPLKLSNQTAFSINTLESWCQVSCYARKRVQCALGYSVPKNQTGHMSFCQRFITKELEESRLKQWSNRFLSAFLSAGFHWSFISDFFQKGILIGIYIELYCRWIFINIFANDV